MAVGSHPLEPVYVFRSVGQAVAVGLAQQVESLVVARADKLPLPLLGHVYIYNKVCHHSLKQLLAVCFVPENLPQRHRIGRIAREEPLVYVYARAHDAAVNQSVAQCGLDKSAAELAVAPVDVVRPLYADVVGELVERRLNSQSVGHREDELLACGQLLRMEKHREKEVAACFALPAVGALAASGSLIVSAYDGKLAIIRRLVASQPRVG